MIELTSYLVKQMLFIRMCLIMIHHKLKKMTAIVASFSIVSTVSPKAYASNFVVPRAMSQRAMSIAQMHFPPNFAMKTFGTSNFDFGDSKKIAFKSNEFIDFTQGYLSVVNCDTLDSIKLEKALGGQPKEYIKKIAMINCKAIDESLFSGCISLTEVAIKNCNKIGPAAFYSCVNLKEVTISSCNEIGDSAFYGCTGLNTVKYEKSTEPNHGANVFTNCLNLNTIYVPADYTGDSFCGISVTKYATASASPSPSVSASPSPSVSASPSPSVSASPSPSALASPSISVSASPSPSALASSSTASTIPTFASKSKNNKTALIASLGSAAAAIVIAGIVFATCYFKKHLCFSQSNPDDSEQCTV